MKYDVCLSFAGEDRPYVEKVAECLKARNVRFFYDNYEAASLWGKDLYTHLDHVYRKSARYCVLFISQHYAENLWTDHERVSAQARAFSEAKEYLLPARFDNTEIPGLRPTIGYVDLRDITPDQLADLICQKLEIIEEPSGSRSSYFEWFSPAVLKTAAGTARIPFYQFMPLAEQLSGFEDTLEGALQGLLEQRREEDGVAFWTHGEDRRFDRLYATASVATALVQLGIPLESAWMDGPGRFLSESNSGDINARAATIFRLLTSGLSDRESVEFVGALARLQIKDDAPQYEGSFLLPQGDSPPPATPQDVWNPSRMHSGGQSFHACHIADVLLHLPPECAKARVVARPVLEGIRRFMVRTLNSNGGWLVDSNGVRTPQTLYGLALCRPMSIPLPKNWAEIAAEALDLLNNDGRGLTTRCFGSMNAAYLARSGQNQVFVVAAEDYARSMLTSLTVGSSARTLSPRDVSLVLRALLSALDVIDRSLVTVFCRQAVRISQQLGIA